MEQTTTNGRLHRPSAEHMLIATQRQLRSTEQAINRLLDMAEIRNRPAVHKSFELTATTPRRTDDVGSPSLSIAILNPTIVVAYLGIGGVSASPGRGAISCPPKGMLVLPLAVDDMEIGVDPADPNLGGGTAIIHVLRFDSVQQPYLGAIP